MLSGPRRPPASKSVQIAYIEGKRTDRYVLRFHSMDPQGAIGMRALHPLVIRHGLVVGAGLAAVGVLAWAVLAWSVLTAVPALGAHNARMDVSPGAVEPGGEITVEGLWGFPSTEVRLRWGGLDGEVIATLKSDGTFGPQAVTIPEAEAGTYVLVADQDVPEDYLWGKNLPARAQVEVTGAGPQASADAGQADAPAHVVTRLAALQKQAPPGVLSLVGVALGVAVLSWLIAGVVSRAARRNVVAATASDRSR